MDRSQRRIWLVSLLVLTSPLPSRNLIAQETQGTQRSYWQAVRAYYCPHDAWETYETHRTEMDQEKDMNGTTR
jgi:hypothetical protein